MTARSRSRSTAPEVPGPGLREAFTLLGARLIWGRYSAGDEGPHVYAAGGAAARFGGRLYRPERRHALHAGPHPQPQGGRVAPPEQPYFRQSGDRSATALQRRRSAAKRSAFRLHAHAPAAGAPACVGSGCGCGAGASSTRSRAGKAQPTDQPRDRETRQQFRDRRREGRVAQRAGDGRRLCGQAERRAGPERHRALSQRTR